MKSAGYGLPIFFAKVCGASDDKVFMGEKKSKTYNYNIENADAFFNSDTWS